MSPGPSHECDSKEDQPFFLAFFEVFVVDPSHHLLGNVFLDQLVRARRSAPAANAKSASAGGMPRGRANCTLGAVARSAVPTRGAWFSCVLISAIVPERSPPQPAA